jgi:hypothetical protein
MMGGKKPETCWAVNKRQKINWKIVLSGWWFIWIVRCCTDLQTLNFEKYSNINFHENPFIRSRVVPCVWTDRKTCMTKLTRFSQFCECA